MRRDQGGGPIRATTSPTRVRSGGPASGAVGLGKLADALAPARVIDVYGGGKTLGSLILRRLGRVPRVGEKLKLGEFDVTIERVRGAAVEVARLQR